MHEFSTTVASLVASEAFQRYCLSPSKEDLAHWEQRSQTEPELIPLIEEARQLVLTLASQVSEQDIQVAYRQLESQLDRTESAPVPLRKDRRTWLRWAGVAATVLLLMSGIWYWQTRPAPTLLQQTAFGEVQTVWLPDSSQVELNANSRLRYAMDWTGTEIREVWLEGEAYFDVTHRPSQPFVLHTDQGEVKVLGTSFNVYQRAEALEVSLITGKVAVDGLAFDPHLLVPGDQLRFEDGKVNQQQIDVETVAAWKTGQMIYRGVQVRQILERLEAEFDWNVSVSQPDMLNRKVTAVLQQNDPQVLLDALSVMYEWEVEAQGDRTYLIR
ncbi:MAG: FecR domain-containing protein [Bacteroidota bacterium]